MFRKLFYLATVLLLCSSCVSRTTYKESGLKAGNPAGKPAAEKQLIWFWQDEFSRP
jgi:hypothetical protein